MSWLVIQLSARFKRRDFTGMGKTVGWAVRERFYERHYGISSSAPVTSAELGFDSAASVDYDPTSYLILRKIFRRLWSNGATNDHTFLDAGCGKGRVLRVAATYPYRKVLGIELSSVLVATAQQNLANICGATACSNVEVLQANAETFDVPDHVGTVFMYNPFLGNTMDSFMANLQRSYERSRRELKLVFVNPLYFDADRYPWLSTVDEFSCFYPHYDTRGMRVAIYRGAR